MSDDSYNLIFTTGDGYMINSSCGIELRDGKYYVTSSTAEDDLD